jgi:hypothetical protein
MEPHEERRTAEMAQNLVKAKSEMSSPMWRDQLQTMAQLRRQKYLAHIAVGFTAGEALYLCTFPLP